MARKLLSSIWDFVSNGGGPLLVGFSIVLAALIGRSDGVTWLLIVPMVVAFAGVRCAEDRATVAILKDVCEALRKSPSTKEGE